MHPSPLGRRLSYVGRFAPTPSGPLHLGSLVTAMASWLDARAVDGVWLVRIEDLDTPRNVPGADQDIIATLAAFGMVADKPVTWQSQSLPDYWHALEKLEAKGLVYRCTCTRREIAESPLAAGAIAVYPVPADHAAWRRPARGVAPGESRSRIRRSALQTATRADLPASGPRRRRLRTAPR